MPICKLCVAAGSPREQCTRVVMESTGYYWKPAFNILQDSVTVSLANGQDVKGRKGHKTDWNDCRWLAHLLRHGPIRPSFIPPKPVRDLRDLTRRRKQVLGNAASERTGFRRFWRKTNVKIGSVLTDVFGVSGQLMLDALLEGKATIEEVANLARHTARRKIPDHPGARGKQAGQPLSNADQAQPRAPRVSRTATATDRSQLLQHGRHR